VNFLGKGFRHGLFAFFFYRVFELPLLRNAQKRTKKKSQEKIFWGWLVKLIKHSNIRRGPSKSFLSAPRMRALQGAAGSGFLASELPLLRNAQKPQNKTGGT
jgi:hypothetical protein